MVAFYWMFLWIRLFVNISWLITVYIYSVGAQYKVFKGTVLKPEDMLDIYEGIKQNEVNHYDFLLTGYMANASTLQSIMQILDDVKSRNPEVVYGM